MRARFWHERWQQDQIGFHQTEINVHLQQFWGQLAAPAEGLVFVPLCGKSSDMLWLRAQGHPVLGIELSPIAVRDFFSENQLKPVISQQGAFERWEVDGLAILLGDFFQLTTDDLAGCSAIYDRASLIALPPDMREQYAAQMLRIAPRHAKTLLVTLEYDQTLAGGPPFAVREDEVRALYEAHYTVTHVRTLDVTSEMSGLRNKGVPKIEDQVFVLEPR